jgi:hypothetical protein
MPTIPAVSFGQARFRFVAHAGLVAVLPLSLSATPKQQCARDLNQLATWLLVRGNTSYAVCPAHPVSRSG